MKIDENLAKMICDLEYLIGSECYNPNSYDGWNDVEGCDFRYPINVPDNDGNYYKMRSNINYNLPMPNMDIAKNIEYIKYRFGSNELYVGKGLIKVLEYLEERYDLDFTHLEKEREE